MLKQMNPHRLLLLCLPLCLLTACVSESQRVTDPDPQPREHKVIPQQVLRVPQEMQDLSGDLLRFHAKHKALPTALKELVEQRIMPLERFAELPDYLYSPSDQYVLRDGRTVILVDSEVRIEGHAWCIVREPIKQPWTIQLNVTPIALSELEAAARQ